MTAGRGEALVRRGYGWSGDDADYAGGREPPPLLQLGPGAKLRELLQVLVRRRKLILLMLVTLNVAGIIAMHHIRPRYTSHASVIIGPRQAQILDLKAVLAGLSGDSEVVESEVQVLRSRKVVRQVVQQLQLDRNPEFNPPPAGPGLKGWLSDRWSGLMSLVLARWNELAPAALRFEPASVEAQAAADPAEPADPLAATTDAVLRHLSVSPQGRSRVLMVSFECNDPALAAAVGNAIVQTYIADQLNAKRDATASAHRWLQDRVAEMRQQVIAADREVADFRQQAGITQARTGNLLSEQLSTLGEQAIKATTDRATAEARLAAFRTGKHGAAGLPEAESSATLQNLRGQQAMLMAQAANLSRSLGDRHPRVLAARAALAAVSGRVGAELGNVASTLEDEVRAARTREAELNADLAKLRKDADRNADSEVELRALQHKADANRALYDRLLARSLETSVEGGLQQPDAQVVSLADTPRRPTFPNPLVLLPIFFITSCIMTGLMVFGLESVDNGFRTLEQVEESLGVTALGIVPRLRRRLLRRLVAAEQPARERSAFAEAIRNLYTGLMLSGTRTAPKVVLVTSALPEEGKTSVVLALARLLALCGKRVVVVDCDLRRPALHAAFGGHRGPGLVDVLTGQARLSDALQGDSESGACLLSAGTPGRHAPDLLASDSMQDLLSRLGQRFDLVLLDTSPVLAVSETRHLSRLADTSVLVVLWQNTRRVAVAAAYRQLRGAGASVAGVLLAQVELKQYAGYSRLGLYRRRIGLYLSE